MHAHIHFGGHAPQELRVVVVAKRGRLELKEQLLKLLREEFLKLLTDIKQPRWIP